MLESATLKIKERQDMADEYLKHLKEGNSEEPLFKVKEKQKEKLLQQTVLTSNYWFCFEIWIISIKSFHLFWIHFSSICYSQTSKLWFTSVWLLKPQVWHEVLMKVEVNDVVFWLWLTNFKCSTNRRVTESPSVASKLEFISGFAKRRCSETHQKICQKGQLFNEKLLHPLSHSASQGHPLEKF